MSLRNKAELKTIIKETIQELFAEEEFIRIIVKKISDKVDDKINKLQQLVNTQEDKIHSLEQKIDDIQQNEKSNNICVYGILEDSNENLRLNMTRLINDSTGVTLKPEDITAVYRIGKPADNTQKPRPVILKLKWYEIKMNIMQNRKKFKGTKIFISEDLTKTRRKLLNDAKAAFGEKQAWTFNGHIFIKKNGINIKLSNSEDLIKQL